LLLFELLKISTFSNFIFGWTNSMTVSFHAAWASWEERDFRCRENDQPKLTPASKLAGDPD
jgi:hypothetical protein